jgi:hypothetical protein
MERIILNIQKHYNFSKICSLIMDIIIILNEYYLFFFVNFKFNNLNFL